MEILRYAGFAEETTFNQTPSPAAAFYVDQTSASVNAPKESELIYEGGLGRAPRLHRPGFYSVSGDVEYAFDIRTIGWVLKWALGGYEYVGDKHEIWGNNNNILPSFCTRLGKDVFEHIFSGCSLDGLSLEVADEYANAKLSIVGAKDSKGTIAERSAVEALIADEYPLVFHEVTIKKSNTDISTKVSEISLEIKNNVKAETGQSLGSRFPRRLIAAEQEVTLSITPYYDDTSFLELIWGGASAPAVGGSTEVSISLHFDAGTDGSMDITLPRWLATTAEISPKGAGLVEQKVEGTALAGTITGLSGDLFTELLVQLDNNQGEMIAGGS